MLAELLSREGDIDFQTKLCKSIHVPLKWIIQICSNFPFGLLKLLFTLIPNPHFFSGGGGNFPLTVVVDNMHQCTRVTHWPLQWRIQRGAQQARAPFNWSQIDRLHVCIKFCIKMLQNMPQIVWESISNQVLFKGALYMDPSQMIRIPCFALVRCTARLLRSLYFKILDPPLHYQCEWLRYPLICFGWFLGYVAVFVFCISYITLSLYISLQSGRTFYFDKITMC